jgi:DNA-binding GntR family transcriptional regulator
MLTDDGWSPYSISLTEQIYVKLKELVALGELIPGQKLPHEHLSQKLNVSPTPIREALSRLVQEGYVTRINRRGYYLNEITLDEAEELYSFREIIELHTIEKAMTARDDNLVRDLKENLKKYRQLVQGEISVERRQVDKEFHLRIAEGCGNRFMKKALDQIFERLILKRRLEGFASRGKEVYEEHLILLDCIIKEDVAMARKVMERHIRKGKANFVVGFGNKSQ